MTNICRCGTYPRMRAAIHRAAELMQDLKGARHDVALTRRAVLQASLSAAGGLAIRRSRPAAGATPSPASRGARDRPAGADEIGALVVIEPDNSITLRVAKSEMGQGVLTSLPMIVAEELECDLAERARRIRLPHRNLIDNDVYGAWAPAARLGAPFCACCCSRPAPRRACGWSPRRLRAGASRPPPASRSDGAVRHEASGALGDLRRARGDAAKIALAAEPAIKPPDQFT